MNTYIMGYPVKSLFDPIQTHAVYQVDSEMVLAVKNELKKNHQATNFRVVKVRNSNLRIVCFKLPK